MSFLALNTSSYAEVKIDNNGLAFMMHVDLSKNTQYEKTPYSVLLTPSIVGMNPITYNLPPINQEITDTTVNAVAYSSVVVYDNDSRKIHMRCKGPQGPSNGQGSVYIHVYNGKCDYIYY